MISDKRLHVYLQTLGGFEEVIEPAELKLLMRNFRYDVRCVQEYFTRVYKTKRFEKLKTPIVFVAGDPDPLIRNYQQRFREWKFFSNAVELAVIKGDEHYFVKHRAVELAQIILESLQSKI